MSHHAHGTVRNHDSATKRPLAPVRLLPSRCQPIGWLDVSASEFFRLLAQHEAGEINLLALPERTGDVVELPDERE